MSADLISPFQLTAQIEHGPKAHNDVRARAAAEEFEAQFLAAMTESMFAGIKTDGPFGGGHGEAVFRSMLNQEYAKGISKAGGIGIADQVYREILKLQEEKQ